MTYEESELRKYVKFCDEQNEKISELEEKLEFANRVSSEATVKYFEQQRKMSELYGKISELEVKLEKEVQTAKDDMAKRIFKEMYDIVCEQGTDCTIIVKANDIKAIAKLYGVKL